MKTLCPNCQTSFRVTPEQLKVRAGKVRCGQCRSVFNALDCLMDDVGSAAHPVAASVSQTLPPSMPAVPEKAQPCLPAEQQLKTDCQAVDIPLEPSAVAQSLNPGVDDSVTDTTSQEEPQLTEADAQELGKATGLILPRDTSEIPGYSKWSEGVMMGQFISPPEKAARWPFILVAVMLLLTLAGQLVFHFRSELSIAAPVLRPTLQVFCRVLGAEIPLPRHVELVNIETSDLQTDQAHGNLLVLSATLRNRANYAQAYPALELSLTNAQDAAIARRVFNPGEYLASKTQLNQAFAANGELAVRLWIEARDISAAGYRLYVFYP